MTRNESEVTDGTPQSSSPGSGQEGTIVAAETVESRKNRYLFRGDDNYRGGPMGFSLGEEADAADIQDAAEHVLRKESQRTSRYTSLTMETKIARKFTSAPDNHYVRKVELLVLRELERQGFIKIWNAEQVHTVLRQGPKKLANQAADVRAAMRKNRELLDSRRRSSAGKLDKERSQWTPRWKNRSWRRGTPITPV